MVAFTFTNYGVIIFKRVSNERAGGSTRIDNIIILRTIKKKKLKIVLEIYFAPVNYLTDTALISRVKSV